jgi:hypothetical protein
VRKARPPLTDTATCASEFYVRSCGHSFAAGQWTYTALYELLELPGSHNVSDLHIARLQQDYDDGLLECKVKVLCRK